MRNKKSNARKAAFGGFVFAAVIAVALWPNSCSAESVVRLDTRITRRLVVSVGLNGKGDHPFLLDTGATTTTLSHKLANKLGLVPLRSAQVHTYMGVVSVPVARMDKIEIGNRSFVGTPVLCADLQRMFRLEPSIEGILGQDVLARFNYLLDRRGQKIEIEEDGELGAAISGTTVPFISRGGKIYISTADGSLRFMLDSGIPYTVFYENVAAKLDLSPIEAQEPVAAESPNGNRALRPARLNSLKVGDVSLRNLNVFLTEQIESGRPEDGFLPVHLFDSIYINNSKGFLILNPRRLEQSQTSGRSY